MIMNLSIPRKLALLLILPMAAFFLYSGLESFERYEFLGRLEDTGRAFRAMRGLGALVHELQKERGLSSGFVSGKGAKFAQELAAQRRLTDEVRAQSEAILLGWKAAGGGAYRDAAFAPVFKRLEELVRVRADVDSLALDTLKTIAAYNGCIRSMLDGCSEILGLASGTGLSIPAAALLQFMHGKELAGQERATLNGAFTAGTFSKQLYHDWLMRVSGQSTYFEVFRGLGGKEAAALLEEKTANVRQEVEGFRRQAYENLDKPGLEVDPKAWFAASTRRIDALMEVETAWGGRIVGLVDAAWAAARNKLLMVGASAFLVGLVTVLAGIRISLGVQRPLRRTLAFAERVSGGDLDSTLDVAQADEIGALAQALRRMVATLKEQIARANEQFALAQRQGEEAHHCRLEAEEAGRLAGEKADSLVRVTAKIQSVAEVVGLASEQLEGRVRQAGADSRAQSARMAENAVSMEQMNASMMEVAKNASRAAQSAEQAKGKAQEGAAVVEQVAAGVRDLENQAAALKADMRGLGDQASNIGRVLGVISDIADQTNLLALNAAIEAARAGDAGRGFAVVADEVRKLAEKTQSATKEVDEAIRGIQQGAGKNVANVEATVETIVRVARMAGDSGQSLREIVGLIDEASDRVRAMAAASEEQSSACEEINRSVEEVSAISSGTVEAMSSAARAVSELLAQASELRELTGEMRQASHG